MKRPGKIVSYSNSNGEEVTAIAYDDEQKASFAGRLFLRVIDEEGNPKKLNGKNIISVKFPSQLQQIGFID